MMVVVITGGRICRKPLLTGFTDFLKLADELTIRAFMDLLEW
jgi:hypothetical protein